VSFSRGTLPPNYALKATGDSISLLSLLARRRLNAALGVMQHLAPYSSSPNYYFSTGAFSPEGEPDETLQSR